VNPIKTQVAGVDVHKDILAITVMIGPEDQEPKIEHFECSTMTDDLKAMGITLKSLGVTDVAVESTGVYWKPVFNVWEPLGLKVIIGNASHIKGIPGRKTDIKDSEWIAQLHRFSLIKPSFVPEGVYQRLRLLSRHRTNLVGDLSRVKNRLEKVLQDGNIKWSSVVSDTFGVAGVAIIDLIADGVTDAQTLASSVKTKIRKKEDAKKALTNCLTTEHIFVLGELMVQYRDLKKRILETENQLTEKILPYADLVEELDKIPGIDKVLAMGIISEATADMSSFKDGRSFAAWAGVASGNNESGGKKKIKNSERQSAPEKVTDSGGEWSQAKERLVLSVQIQKASCEAWERQQGKSSDSQQASQGDLQSTGWRELQRSWVHERRPSRKTDWYVRQQIEKIGCGH
jgi:transposase